MNPNIYMYLWLYLMKFYLSKIDDSYLRFIITGFNERKKVFINLKIVKAER